MGTSVPIAGHAPLLEVGKTAMKREVATHPDALPRAGEVGNSCGASHFIKIDEGGNLNGKQKKFGFA